MNSRAKLQRQPLQLESYWKRGAKYPSRMNPLSLRSVGGSWCLGSVFLWTPANFFVQPARLNQWMKSRHSAISSPQPGAPFGSPSCQWVVRFLRVRINGGMVVGRRTSLRMSECTLWQGPVLATTRRQGVMPPQEHGGMMTRWQAVLPQWLGVATMRRWRVVPSWGQEEEAGMWPQRVAPLLCGHFLAQPVSPACIPHACSFHELRPMRGVPVLECVTHHAIFEGLDPCMTVCIHHVSIEPSYEFLPKSSVGRVALL